MTGAETLDETHSGLLWSSLALTAVVWLGASLPVAAAMLCLAVGAQGATSSRAFRLMLAPLLGAGVLVLVGALLSGYYDHHYAGCGAPGGSGATVVALGAMGLGISGAGVAFVFALIRPTLAARVLGLALAVVGCMAVLLTLGNAFTDWCGT